ncbi:MAG: transposase, partial [Phenylobacterium sp.]|nr:transposase [Phenylobacterium sp.]
VYDLPANVEALNPLLDSFQHLYNHHRPHGALAGMTPARYLARLQASVTPPSHMS